MAEMTQRDVAFRDAGDGTYTQRWWLPDLTMEDVFIPVIGQVSALRQTHDDRVLRLDAWYALYSDDAHRRENLEAVLVQRDRRARFNVAQNAVDSVHARITRNKPKPWVVTSGGRQMLQQRAQTLNKYLEGEFARTKLPKTAAQVAKDALIFGTGCVKIYPSEGRPRVERIRVRELMVDPREAQLQEVRTLYQLKAIDRGVLLRMFPEHRDTVEGASRMEDDVDTELASRSIISDMVMVVEGWHLPSDSEADDGRHVICVDSGTLFDERWERSCFPFAFLHWAEDPYGFWGRGLVERMAGTQSELNETTTKISDAFTVGAPSVWVDAGSQVKTAQIDNEPGRIYTYTGTPPLFMTPQAISPEYLQREQQLISYSYEMQGISQMSAQSVKPAGLNSGKALRIHHDIESERFSAHSRDWEEFHIEVSRLILECTEEIFEDEEHARREAKEKGEEMPESDLVVYVGEQTLEAIEYVEGRLEDAPYQVRVFPVSALSSSPQGRLQDIQDLIDLGVITEVDDIRELLDYPDLQRYNDIHSSGRRLCNLMIEKALKGEKVQANPYLPLPYLHKMSIYSVNLSEYDEPDNEKGRQRLRDLIGHVETLIMKGAEEMQEAQMGAAAMGAPGAPGPSGPPMAPPGAPGAGPPQGGQPMPPPVALPGGMR